MSHTKWVVSLSQAAPEYSASERASGLVTGEEGEKENQDSQANWAAQPGKPGTWTRAREGLLSEVTKLCCTPMLMPACPGQFLDRPFSRSFLPCGSVP
jgi:hypothetical protein